MGMNAWKTGTEERACHDRFQESALKGGFGFCCAEKHPNTAYRNEEKQC
jgi:hypothetical protein